MSRQSTTPFTPGEDGIALITLEPHRESSGKLLPDALSSLVATLQSLAERSDVRGLLLHAQGPHWLPQASAQAWLDTCRLAAPVDIARVLAQRSEALRTVEQLDKPVAIVIEGDCLDLCLELALACHLRVGVASDRQRFCLPLVKRGIPPCAGATQRLPRLAGIAEALPVLLSGDSWNTETALQRGVLHAVGQQADALADARAWLASHPGAKAPWDAKGFRTPGGSGALASGAGHHFTDRIAGIRQSTHDTQPAPMSTLSAVYEGTQLPIDMGLQIEVQCAAQTLADPATANQIRSQWLHQEQARALIRRPLGLAAQPVQRLGVLGAGLMGAGIAQVAAAAGIDVVLIDTHADHVHAARDRVLASLRRSHGDRADAIVDRIHATAELRHLHDCDFIIEAVFEDRSVKAGLMDRAASVLRERSPHFVWASNTSTLPIGGLARHWEAPGQVIGMHFFSPVPRMPLLEIITGSQTSDATLARTMDLAARLGKTPILVNDSPGFYTSRIFCAYIDEGMAMLAEGVQPALIENMARQAGFATSPLAVTDEVSLDLQALVIEQARNDGLDEKLQRLQAQPVVARMNALGRLGRKSGGGFYDYPESGAKQLWGGLAREFPLADRQPSPETVRARLLNRQALESVRCLEEGVLTSPADGDIGSLLGLGYPAWTGGTFSYIDTVGLQSFVQSCDALADVHGERFRPSAWLRERAADMQRFHD